MAERYGAGGAIYNPPVVKEKKEVLTEVPPKRTYKKKTITNDQQLSEGQQTLQELIDENSEILND